MSQMTICDECGRKITGLYWELGPRNWSGAYRVPKPEYENLTFDTSECLYAWVAQHVQVRLEDTLLHPED